MKKKSDAYNRHQAALRSARKRQADKTKRVPSTAQITTAIGHAARAFIADHRAAGSLETVRPLIDATLEKLRSSGHVVEAVTISRLLRATSKPSPITPSN
ncbi:hypothetical protein [Lichenifustis flavocetrariae]|uniref:Uncharacterized protein n=1 Tax=Lichenifustis flavocetrariae TaxID=2949735 RepID=A0AA42CR59_9HYPH|nr:hypothetical protein [Lichenifustis flavocetrariae]MCW6512125.1 hypothetical protein [Lichenifustis flavocetrariae]